MENITSNDLKNMCRTCMFTSELKLIEDNNIIVILHCLTGIQYSKTDELPQQICRKCFQKMNEIYDFGLQCKQSYLSFKKCLANFKNKQNEYNIEEPNNTVEFIQIKEEVRDDFSEEYIVNKHVKDEITIEEDMIKVETSNNFNTVIDKPCLKSEININQFDNTTNTNDNPLNDLLESGSNNDKEIKTNNKKIFINTENKFKEYICETCKKTFKYLTTFKRHLTVHNNIRPYECDMIEQSVEIPERILEKVTESVLPKKSKEAYDREYDKFECWLVNNCVEIINETMMLRYFEELSESFTPTSLWTKYSMLKKMVLIKKNIDIGKHHKLGEYLKQESKGYEAKKSKVLTREEMLKFVNEAPNKTFLMVKVALLFCVFGGCRLQEFVNMLVDHIEDRGSVFVVNIPETKTDKKRVFRIIEENDMSNLKLIRDYASLRPQGCSERRFFLNYRNGRCTSQPVGKNTFGKIPSTIATYLDLRDADKYTGHCLRRTSATLLADAGVSTTSLKRHGGWKSTIVSEEYLEDSLSSKNKILKM